MSFKAVRLRHHLGTQDIFLRADSQEASKSVMIDPDNYNQSRMRFKMKTVPYIGDACWVGGILHEPKFTFETGVCPEYAEDSEFFSFIDMIW